MILSMLQGGDEEAIQSGQPWVTGSDRRAGQEGREKLQYGGQVPEWQVSRQAEKNYSMQVKSQNDMSSHRDVIQQISLRDITQHGRTP